MRDHTQHCASWNFTAQAKSADFLNTAKLMTLKMKAMRRGLWFRTLNRLDRALVDLTIKVSSNVRSGVLAKGLLLVVGKLQDAFESKLARATREIGFSLAQNLSEFAQKWGNSAAKEWGTDRGYARYLAVMALNRHT